MLGFAVVFISAALIFYTIGVWGEKFSKALKLWHLIMFWIGFACDTTGTTLMGKLAHDVFAASFHSITGALAILLMAAHAIWATAVLIRNRENEKKSFHKFSIAVWVIWLIPYFSGMIYGMMQ